MRRRILRVLTVCSAVILLAAGLLWVRSIFRDDRITLALGNRRLWLGSSAQHVWARGAFSLETSLTANSHLGKRADGAQPVPLLPTYERTMLARAIRIPYWLIVLVALPLPIRALAKRRIVLRMKSRRSIARRRGR